MKLIHITECDESWRDRQGLIIEKGGRKILSITFLLQHKSRHKQMMLINHNREQVLAHRVKFAFIQYTLPWFMREMMKASGLSAILGTWEVGRGQDYRL